MLLFSSVEEFYIPARRIWIPIPPLTMVDERFDLSKKIISWKWGNNSETYSYDAEERLDKVIVGGKDEIRYVYDQTNFPKQVQILLSLPMTRFKAGVSNKRPAVSLKFLANLCWNYNFCKWYKAALSNPFATRHMWRMAA